MLLTRESIVDIRLFEIKILVGNLLMRLRMAMYSTIVLSLQVRVMGYPADTAGWILTPGRP